jgi:GntR family transcriptional repressor for pyruvate dehydrogenase complex
VSPLTAVLRLHLATNHLPMGDVVQTRILLESWSAREAAGRSLHAGELQVAEDLLERMDAAGLSPEQFHLLDAEFHVALSGLAGNVLIAAVMTSLRSAIHEYVLAAVPNLADWEATAVGLRAEHRAILGTIREGAPERAAELVAAHIRGFYQAAQLAPFADGEGTAEPDDDDRADEKVQ